MSDQPMNKSRRDAVKIMLGGLASVPLANLVAMAAAQASELPKVDPASDPTALALKYVHDATEADRAGAARPGAAPEEQNCANCQFFQELVFSDDAGDWHKCQLFAGKVVNAQGWCTSWTLKA